MGQVEGCRRQDDVDVGIGSRRQLVQRVPHGPRTLQGKTGIGDDLLERRRITDDGKVQWRQPQEIDPLCRSLRCLFRRLDEGLGQPDIGTAGSGQIAVDAVGPEPQRRQARPGRNQALDSLEVRADGVRHGTAADGDKAGMGRFHGFSDIVDEALVIALDGIDFVETGNIDHTRRIVPPRFVVRIVCRITARCIVHDDEAA